MFVFKLVNYDTVIKDINDSIESIYKVETTIKPNNFISKYWGKIRKEVVVILKNSMEYIHDVPVNESWTRVKKELIGAPIEQYPVIISKKGFKYTTERRRGGGWEKVTSSQNWKATGIMHDTIISGLESGRDRIINKENLSTVFIDVDVGHLRNNYPVEVDQYLMDASGGKVGIMRLPHGDQEKVLDIIEKNFDIELKKIGNK